MYFIGAGAALIIIGGVAGMAKHSMGDMAWIVVALMAVGNAGGRIVAQTGTQNTAYLLCSILLVAGALVSLMTSAPEESRQEQNVWVRFREKLAFAKAQTADVFLGTRHI